MIRAIGRRRLSCLLLAGTLGLSACGGRTDPAAPQVSSDGAPTTRPAEGAASPAAAATDGRTAANGTSGGASGPAGDSANTPAAPAKPAGPSPVEIWTARLAEAKNLLDADKLDELDALREGWTSDSQTPPEQFAEPLEKLAAEATAKRAALTAKQRERRLAEAQTLMNQGKLDDAVRAVGDVLARNPTDEQRQLAAGLSEEVERRRKARRQLKSWMQMLTSDDRKNVQTAQTQLLQDADTAVGMVLESLATAEPGLQTTNYLETLRLLNRPDVTQSAMLDLLENTERAALWPDVVRELNASGAPGSGERLLKLAVESGSPEQRAAALEALAHAPDPPARTLVALAPTLGQDGPLLPAALRVATHAVKTHEQFDWVAGRSLDSDQPFTAEQLAALDSLAARLVKLAGSTDAAALELKIAAEGLAALLGLVDSRPVPSVQVVRAEAELPESPAAGVLDGVWNAVDLKSMWRHPPDRRGSILLDLGADRTVTAVRIWNLNEPGAVQRGWKEVELFVSSSPAELAPVARGVVPVAPGVANPLDYATTIPIPAVRGRYVRIQAKSVWQGDGPNGLSEIQVLAVP